MRWRAEAEYDLPHRCEYHRSCEPPSHPSSEGNQPELTDETSEEEVKESVLDEYDAIGFAPDETLVRYSNDTV